VISRTLSLTTNLLRYKHTTALSVIDLYSNRVVGDVPSLLLFTLTLFRHYRHLYHDWRYTLAMGLLTAALLFALSFWDNIRELYCRRQLGVRPSHGDYRAVTNALDDLALKLKSLRDFVERADVSDPMKSHFMLVQKQADFLDTAVCRYLLVVPLKSQSTISRASKAAVFVVTLVVQGQAIYASYRYPWLVSVSAGWAIWVTVCVGHLLFAGYATLDDMSRLFSNIAAGPLVMLPLTIPISTSQGRVLNAPSHRLAVGVALVVLVNCFSNLVETVCYLAVRFLIDRSERSSMVTTQISI
jgi:hypothetical protein